MGIKYKKNIKINLVKNQDKENIIQYDLKDIFIIKKDLHDIIDPEDKLDILDFMIRILQNEKMEVLLIKK